MFNQERGVAEGKAAVICPNPPSAGGSGNTPNERPLRREERLLGLRTDTGRAEMGDAGGSRLPAFWLREMLEDRPLCHPCQPYTE